MWRQAARRCDAWALARRRIRRAARVVLAVACMKTLLHHSMGIAACCLSLVAFGCNKSDKAGAEAQHEATQAQAHATTETTKAQIEANKKAETEQAEANKKIAKEEASFSKTREDYRSDMQNKLVELDKKIADLDTKEAKATGNTKAKLEQHLPGIHKERQSFEKDFAALQHENDPATWDTSKARLDKEYDALKNAVDHAD